MGFQLSTFLFEVLNFIVLLWLLNRIAFRPLAAGLKQRREREEAAALAAEEERAKLRQLRCDLESQQASAREERERLHTSAVEAANQTRDELLERAQREARAERQKHEKLLADAQARVERELGQQAIHVGARSAGEILRHIASSSLNQELWQRFLIELEQENAHSTSRRIVSGGGLKPPGNSLSASEPKFTLFSSHALGQAQRAELKHALAQSQGAQVQVEFVEDADLYCGYKLETESQSFEVSLRQHLHEVANTARQELGGNRPRAEQEGEAQHVGS